MKSRVALVHAVTVAIEPVHDAFRRLWPDAMCTNLLDDAVLLAHFSTARAAPAVGARLDVPLYTSPGSAVEKMCSLILSARRG